jgi:hypothetical protein
MADPVVPKFFGFGERAIYFECTGRGTDRRPELQNKRAALTLPDRESSRDIVAITNKRCVRIEDSHIWADPPHGSAFA